ncbi:RimK family protein [Noviherbaspirillum galbum]|uniref:RimK family protein n=1 Tax=Noviherbaspirillum galbum TaxID=2709383 RepID=A0A6B3SVG0_9BURK|nr:RimK family protein [Noviherbaspirillum galbum]NEX64624.1 RimK family protein [Noviherbaspirillum galbum]
MKTFIVTDHRHEWFEIAGATAVTARRYLAEPENGSAGAVQVLNLCRTGRYQGRGYYVSLLAEARGQRPVADVKTIENLRSEGFLRALAAEFQPLVQETLHHNDSERFQLDIYFGRHPSHEALAEKLFARVRAPLLRVLFVHSEGSWRLDSLRAIGLADIPLQDRALLLEAVQSFICDSPAPRRRGAEAGRPRLAVLWDPDEVHKPSNEEALQRFLKAAPLVGLDAELIGPDALDRLDEFDALFNRSSPGEAIIYEFLRKAESLGMPVVDDPESVLKCGNKVFMQELLNRHGIATPRTLIVHRNNVQEIIPTLGLPCVLKLPDSGFGLDVVKIESEENLRKETERFFSQSELLIAQEWLPSDFDWRVGVYDRRPLFAAKYFMAPGHWKIIKLEGEEQPVEGKTEATTIGEVPGQVISTAVRAANLIGRGLYGADLKQVGDRIYLIEVNINPNIDAGNEDQVLGEGLYREILGVFARRIAETRAGVAQHQAP